MFSLYNLLELQDYRSLPSRYRYFYLELSKMVYLIKYKTTKNEAPFYVLTVDQLAKKLGHRDCRTQRPEKEGRLDTEKDEYLPEIYQFQFLFL